MWIECGHRNYIHVVSDLKVEGGADSEDVRHVGGGLCIVADDLFVDADQGQGVATADAWAHRGDAGAERRGKVLIILKQRQQQKYM